MKSLGSTTITTTKHTKEIEIEKFIESRRKHTAHTAIWGDQGRVQLVTQLPHGEIGAGCRQREQAGPRTHTFITGHEGSVFEFSS